MKYKLLRGDAAERLFRLKRGGFYGTFGRHPSEALFTWQETQCYAFASMFIASSFARLETAFPGFR